MEKQKTTLGAHMMITIGAILLGLGIIGDLGGWGDVDVIIGSMVFIIPGGLLLGFGMKKKKKAKQDSETKNTHNNESDKDMEKAIDVQAMVNKESKDVQKTQVKEEGVIYCFETNIVMQSGTIKFYEDRYKFVSKKGKVIEAKYSDLEKVKKSMGCIALYDRNGHCESFPVSKKLMPELLEFVQIKISENVHEEKADNITNVSDKKQSISEENNSEKNKSNFGNIIGWIVLPGILFLGDLYAFLILLVGNPIVNLLLLVVFMLWCVAGIQMFLHTCPKCKEWAGLKEINRELLNTKDITIKKTVEDKVYAGNNTARYGQPQKYIKRTVYVPGTEYTYNVGYKCKKCGYVEYRTETEKEEN